MNPGMYLRTLRAVFGLVILGTAAGCGGSGPVSSGNTQSTPTITWATPADIVYGTALSATQLNATASAAGSFTYSPALGSVLSAGTHTLSVSFTPNDSNAYTSAQASVSLVVTKATPALTWANPAAIVYGTQLSSTQLNAATPVAGAFAYSPAAGVTLGAGTQTLNVSFTPTDTADYNAASSSVSLVVAKATAAISWAAPASIASGSTLSAAQLDATSAVSGSFVYTPAAGTTETVPGSLTLQAVFTPTDTADYLVSTVTNTLTVTPAATPTYSWTSVTINAGGFTDGLYFHPKQQGLLYAKMDIADAYRFNTTTNRWVSLLDWIDRQQGNYFGTDEYAVGSLALDPTNPNKLYLAVGIGTGSQPGNLLISQNQGSTFTNVQLPFTVRSNANGREGGERMAVDPNLPSRLYFGTVNDGLWYSDNGGLTWTQSSTFPALGTANAQGISFVLPVATSGTAGSLTPLIFAGVAESTSAGALNTLYVSTNAGTTWTPVRGQISGSLLPIRGRLGPSHELYVTYDNAIGPDGITQGMICAYTYTDAGVISAPRNITPNLLAAGETAGYVDIEPDPSTPGALLTASIDGSLTINGVGQDYIYRSVDDGNTWISFANDTHDITPTPWLAADMRNHDSNWINLAVDPFNPKHVLYGTGSMIFATNDITVAGGAVAWYEQAVGDEEHNVVALAAPPTGPTILYSGLHDHNGMAHTSLTAAPPRYPNANTNMASSIAYAEDNPLIVARVGGNKNFTATAGPYGAYSDDGGTTWTTFANTPLPASATGDGSIAVSADGSTLVWAPYDVPPVYSTDQGQTWTLSAGAPSPSKKVVADHLNTNVFYMSSMTYGSYPPSNTGGALYMSTDKGRTFHPVAGTSALPAGDVYANFALAGDVWLASPSGGLYRNSATPTAIVMSKVGVFSYAYHMAFGAPKPGSGYNYTVYVDGNIDGVDGVYRSTDGGASWQLINDQQHQYGYLNVLEADRRTFGTVYLGPGGRGIIWGTSSN